MAQKDKHEFKLEDVTLNDARMIMRAASLDEKSWFCYGRAWFKLYILELIDEDTRPTPLGKAVANHLLGEAA